MVAERLAEWGHDDFTSYVVWACERALERGMLPHTNIGVLERDDLARLREVTASQGLMLESISERLMETVHAGSPDQASGAAAGDDRGRRRAEDPVHQRDPGRHRRDRGRARRIARSAGGRATSATATSRRSSSRTSSRTRATTGRRWPRSPIEASRREVEGATGHPSGEQPPWMLRRRGRPVTPCPAARLGDAGRRRRHQAVDPGVQAVDAGCGGPGAAEPVRRLGRAGRGRGDRSRRAVGERGSHLAGAAVSQSRIRCGRSWRRRAMR